MSGEEQMDHPMGEPVVETVDEPLVETTVELLNEAMDDAQVEGTAEWQTPRHPGLWRLVLIGAAAAGLVLAAQFVDGVVHLPLGSAAQGVVATDEAAVSAASPWVTSASVGCPGQYLGVADDAARAQVGLMAATAPTEVIDDPGGGGTPVGSASLHLTRGGERDVAADPVELEVDDPSGAWLQAEGRRAAGAVASQVALSTEPGGRGLSVAACTGAQEVQWLVGGSGEPGRSEQLVLVNPGADAVTATVSIWGADGPVTMTGGGGIVVPPHGQVVQLVDGFAPAVESPVIRVEAGGGPVVAHLGVLSRDGTTDLGSEIVTNAAEPSTDLVLPALPREGTDEDEGAESGPVTVRLVAPGDQPAVVDLTALTKDGAQRLSSHVTRIPAGHTVDVVLDDLPAGVNALRIRSDVPVTAGAQSQFLPRSKTAVVVKGEAATKDVKDSTKKTTKPPAKDTGTSTSGPTQAEPLVHPAGDLAWVAASALHTGPVGIAIPDLSGLPGAELTLAVTAVDAVDARLVWLRADGTTFTDDLDRIPNDSTRTIVVPAAARAVWVMPEGTAGVAAALHVVGADDLGPFAASTTLPGVPWTRVVTQVQVRTP
ncbi:MAG: DUF5719 family protein [Ornithinimicrobium sp.]|uniref:DUF5719 family protein n=1 Tax=Ornithinimicrobium sp. TaxID=1977084 RepID=UPI0026DFBC50|nr:DUF5719 family protein [Ornithinimicrobium sp.]MDO5739570.1 DUF5719 family protein [Ornithinimicrobium sp.]